MYYDDIEVANPLGSRAGYHKLGTKYNNFYTCTITFITLRMLLLYIGKHQTSFSIISIFYLLLAIAKSSLLHEFTADAIFDRFVQQMNQLSHVRIMHKISHFILSKIQIL